MHMNKVIKQERVRRFYEVKLFCLFESCDDCS